MRTCFIIYFFRRASSVPGATRPSSSASSLLSLTWETGKIKLVFMQAALDLDKLWGAEVDFPTSWAYKIFSTRSASKDFLCFLRLKESERAREGPTTPFPFGLNSRTGNKKRWTLIKSSAEDVGTNGEDLWRGVKLRLSHCLMARRH